MKFIKVLLLLVLIISTECKIKRKITQIQIGGVKLNQHQEIVYGIIKGLLSVWLGNEFVQSIVTVFMQKLLKIKNTSTETNKECNYEYMLDKFLTFEKKISDESQKLVETVPEIYYDRGTYDCIVVNADKKIDNFETKKKKLCLGFLEQHLEEVQESKQLAISRRDESFLKLSEDMIKKITKQIEKYEPGWLEKIKDFCEIRLFWKKDEATIFSENIMEKFKEGISVSVEMIKCAAKKKISSIENAIKKAENSKSGKIELIKDAIVGIFNICFQKIGGILSSVYGIIDQVSRAIERRKQKRYVEYGEALGAVIGHLLKLIKEALMKKKFLKKK